jgi:hypothetical protein
MSGGRLVNVFWRGDGRVLVDETWGASPPSSARPRPADPALPAGGGRASLSSRPAPGGSFAPVSAATVWSLVQVFIQFSREVDGGNVQRLVFRDPVQPVGKRRVFGAAPAGPAAASPQPVLIHVAHDALFAVTVTEALPPDASQLRRLRHEFPAGQFAHDVLLYFSAEQAAFLNSSAAPAGTAATSTEQRRAEISAGGRSRQPTGADGGAVAGAAAPAASRSPGGGAPGGQRPPLSNLEIQRSYASDTSGSGTYASHASISLDETFASSSDEGRGSEDGAAAVPPMMPIEGGAAAQEVRRILATYQKRG